MMMVGSKSDDLKERTYQKRYSERGRSGMKRWKMAGEEGKNLTFDFLSWLGERQRKNALAVLFAIFKDKKKIALLLRERVLGKKGRTGHFRVRRKFIKFLKEKEEKPL